jgi:zinc transporter ZupT
VHLFAEGLGVGVSFGGGESLGLVTAIAIAIHNIPEVSRQPRSHPQGVGVLRAAGWSILSSLPQPLVAVPAFLFVAFFDGMVPLGLGFAGGAMLWMVAAQVVPECARSDLAADGDLALSGSTAAMLGLEALLLA